LKDRFTCTSRRSRTASGCTTASTGSTTGRCSGGHLRTDRRKRVAGSDRLGPDGTGKLLLRAERSAGTAAGRRAGIVTVGLFAAASLALAVPVALRITRPIVRLARMMRTDDIDKFEAQSAVDDSAGGRRSPARPCARRTSDDGHCKGRKHTPGVAGCADRVDRSRNGSHHEGRVGVASVPDLSEYSLHNYYYDNSKSACREFRYLLL